MTLNTWAKRNNIPASAVAELRTLLIGVPDAPPAEPGASEAAVQTQVRLAASRRGDRLWRNNVGAGQLENGSYVRWGLCNDSAALNHSIKSSDLIGIRSVTITAEMVGHTLGQFVARECKHGGWKYTGTERERAQARFIELILAMGGDAAFTNGSDAA